jgi:hypothetical protein
MVSGVGDQSGLAIGFVRIYVGDGCRYAGKAFVAMR